MSASTLVTFLFQLPVDLGVRDGATTWIYEPRGEVIGRFFAAHARTSEAEIDTRLVFRRSRIDRSPERTVATDAFADFWQDVKLIPWDPIIAGAPAHRPVTVVAATRVAPAELSEDGPRLSEELATAAFEKVLGQLNRFLDSFGLMCNSPEIGAIRRTDLPTHVPMAVHVSADRSGHRVELVNFQVHGWDEGVTVGDDVVLDAQELASRDHLLRWPLLPVLQVLQQARRDFYDGASLTAAIGFGTSIEVLVSIVLAERLRASGAPEERIARTLEAGFRNLLRDHLMPWFVSVGADANAVESWLSAAYVCRNAAAHQGRIPTQAALTAAWQSTFNLLTEITAAARADPVTAQLGALLPFGPKPGVVDG